MSEQSMDDGHTSGYISPTKETEYALRDVIAAQEKQITARDQHCEELGRVKNEALAALTKMQEREVWLQPILERYLDLICAAESSGNSTVCLNRDTLIAEQMVVRRALQPEESARPGKSILERWAELMEE
jgi:hypothetical protein